jgi:hypothetical protein
MQSIHVYIHLRLYTLHTILYISMWYTFNTYRHTAKPIYVIYIFIYSTPIYLYIYTFIHLYLYLFLSQYTYTYLHTSTPIYMYIIICFYANITIYIYTVLRPYTLSTCLRITKSIYALYMFIYIYDHIRTIPIYIHRKCSYTPSCLQTSMTL